MPDCAKLPKCLFFNDKMGGNPAMATMFKKRFCQTDNSQCARFMVASAGKEVPADLFPNQSDRARTIIAS